MTKEKIKDIAENLDCGFRCFIHIPTKDVKFIPDRDRHPDMDTETWNADIEEIENNLIDYTEICAMDRRDSFRLMVNFVDTVNDERVKERLGQALSGVKPFGNFKFQIDNSGRFRDTWFKFKENRLMEWVNDQLKENDL